MDDHQRIVMTARAIHERLASGRFDELEFLSENNFSQEQCRLSVESYPASVTTAPADFDDEVDIIEVEDAKDRSWSVVFPLWTIEEGRSDLSVTMTCIDRVRSDGTLDFEIYGIYVR